MTVVEVKYNDGTRYIGTLENGQPAGLGTMEYPNGSAFLGFWSAGQMNDDKGLYRFPTGECYEGRITNNELQYDEESKITYRNRITLWSGERIQFERRSEYRVAIYMDHSNIEANFGKIRSETQHIDYNRMCGFLSDGMRLVRRYVFGSVSPEDVNKFDWFKKNNYTMKIRERRHSEKGVDVDLATTVLMDANNDVFDVAVIVSGDADFIPVAESLKEMGKKVIIASFKHSLSGQYYDFRPDHIEYLDNAPIYSVGDLEFRIREILPRSGFKKNHNTLCRGRTKQYLAC